MSSQAEEQMILKHLLGCLVFVKCSVFWGGQLFRWLSAGQADWLEAPNPPLSLVGLRIMGSLRTSSLGHHPNICSSVKPLQTTFCHILTFIPSHSVIFIDKEMQWKSLSTQRLYVWTNLEYTLIFNMFFWTQAYRGACFIVSVASCLVFPVFVGPFCWVKWLCLTWGSLLFPPPLRTKAGLGGLCRALLYCFTQLSTALHTHHTNQPLLSQHTDTVDMETTVIRTPNCRLFYKEKLGNRPRKFN